VDSQEVVCRAFARLADGAPAGTDFAPVATTGVASVSAAIAELRRGRFDLVVTELDVPEGGGLELIKRIRRRGERIPILVFTFFDETQYALRSLRAGANGYLSKRAALSELHGAIRSVLDGEIRVSRAVSDHILAAFRDGASSGTKAIPGTEAGPGTEASRLTDRELHVFRLLGSGWSPQRIAADLRVSVRTVDSHRTNLMRKLDVRGPAELLRRAVTWVSGSALDTLAPGD
jgi:DNA-binding NarL/FixJ family response regulator